MHLIAWCCAGGLLLTSAVAFAVQTKGKSHTVGTQARAYTKSKTNKGSPTPQDELTRNKKKLQRAVWDVIMNAIPYRGEDPVKNEGAFDEGRFGAPGLWQVKTNRSGNLELVIFTSKLPGSNKGFGRPKKELHLLDNLDELDRPTVIEPETAIHPASTVHSGMQSEIRVAFSPVGPKGVVLLKRPAEEPGESKAEILGRLLIEARGAKLLSDSGMGPQLLGLHRGRDGHLYLVFEPIQGELATPVVTRDTLIDVEHLFRFLFGELGVAALEDGPQVMFTAQKRTSRKAKADLKSGKLKPWERDLLSGEENRHRVRIKMIDADKVAHAPTQESPEARSGEAVSTDLLTSLLVLADPDLGEGFLQSLKDVNPKEWKRIVDHMAMWLDLTASGKVKPDPSKRFDGYADYIYKARRSHAWQLLNAVVPDKRVQQANKPTAIAK